MLQRQKLWVPVLQHSPSFPEFFARFLVDNPITCLSVAALNIQPTAMKVALQPDARQPGRQVAAMLAVSVRVLRPACDALPQHPSEGGAAALNFGFATALADSMNSFHVMERLLPAFVPHVSVNIQCQLLSAPSSLAEGTDLVVVSSIDKLGKRLVYCTTDLYVDEISIPPEVAKREAEMETLSDLQGALKAYKKVLHGTHVKSILLDDKKAKKE